MTNPNRTLCRYLLVGVVMIPFQAVGAASPQDRACNLQGREIALRISEEVSSDLSATARGRIAAIAEEVCIQYAGDAPAPPEAPVAGRPAAAGPAPQAVTAPQAPETAVGEAQAEEEEGGLFNFRIIDPEDRVQRPGLKRR